MAPSEISIEEYERALKNLKELKRAKEELDEAQRIAHIGNWDWNIRNNELSWSDEIYRIFGLKPHQFGATYEAFLSYVHPDDRNAVITAVNEALYNKKPYSIDHRIVLSDGTQRIVHEQAEVTFDEGKPIRMLGTVQDITDQKLTQQKLQESELKYRSMMEALEDLVYICSADYRVEYMNPMMIRRTGRDATGEYCYVALHDRDSICPWCIHKHVQQGESLKAEVLSPKDNRIYSFSHIPIFHADGTISKMAIIRDITEQKKVEEELKKYHERLEELVIQRTKELELKNEQRERAEEAHQIDHTVLNQIFNMAIPICLIDKNYNMLRVNDTFCSFVGISMEEAMQKKCYELLRNPYCLTEKCANIKLAVEKRSEYNYEVELTTGDNRKIVCMVSAYPYKDPKGEFLGIVKNFMDITERKQTEAALEKSEQQLLIVNQIANIFLTVPDDEMFSEVLAIILNAFESKYGVFGYIDELGNLNLPSLTREVWEMCQVPDKSIIFPRAVWGGIWGNALKERRSLYSNIPFNVPTGHIPISRALAVPILFKEEVIGLLLIGDKPTAYNEADRLLLEKIADYIAPVLHARMQRDKEEKERKEVMDALQKSEYQLKERIKELRCLYKISRIAENPNVSLDELLQSTIESIPEAMQFPELICAKLFFNAKEFKTPIFKETGWNLKFYTTINEKILSLEVFYLENKPFFAEEEALIQEIGIRLHTFIIQKQGEEALYQSEQRYRLLFENIGAGIEYYDLNGKLLLINKLGAANLKGNPRDFLGKSVFEIFNKETANLLMKRISEMRDSKEIKAYEDAIDLPIGKKSFISLYNNIQDSYGNNIGVQIISTDITERINFENMRRQFVSTTSHELRTPISVIIQSMNNLMKYQEKLSETQRTKIMEGLSRNALLLGELIEDLLLVSTLEEKKIRLDWITYQPSQILQDILQQLEPRQRAKELTIEYEVDENIKLHGDPKRIGQVFRVIIDNAIKYSGDRTKIMVKAIDHYIGKYNPQNIDGMLIQFSDSGRGIRQQDIPYLFERFFRSEEVQTIPGTGLGLSIARNLVQLHQGEIYVESVYGKGSTFFVFLPRIEHPPQI